MAPRRTRPVAACGSLLMLAAACTASSTAGHRLSWHQVDTGAIAPGGTHAQVAAIQAGPPWLLAGALAPDNGSEPTPAVWSSTDGRTWQTRTMLAITPDGVHSRILSIARRGDVSVALGNRPSPLHGNARPTVWRAVGTGPFNEVPMRRELFGGPDLITFGRVVATPQGFLVAGAWDAPAGESVAVWSSADGTSWIRIDRDPAFFAPAGQLVRALAVGASSSVVVAGQVILTLAGHPGANRPAVWLAPSAGGPWSRGAVDTEPAGQQGTLDQIRLRQATGTALGWSGAGRTITVWWSSDGGQSWTEHGLPGGGAAPPAGRDERGMDLAGDDRTLVAAVATRGQLRVWESPADRQQWASLAAPGQAGSPVAVVVSVEWPNLILADPVAGHVWMATIGG